MANLARQPYAPRSDSMATVTRLDPDTAWAAFMRRDRSWDGKVIGAVHTTGIYCKPSCPARRPKRENVTFYASAEEARAAGFRQCLRCKPDEVGRDREAVAAAVKLIEGAEEAPSLTELAEAVGYAPHHFQRMFKRDLGVSPAVQFNNTSANASSSYWDFGTTQDFSTSQSPSFSYNSTGVYTVVLIVTSSTGCTDTTSRQIIVLDNALSVASAGPPAASSLIVKTLDDNLFVVQASFEKETAVSLQLIDATGRLISEYSPAAGKQLSWQIDLGSRAHGIYFLTMSSAAGKKVLKLPAK